MHLESTEGKWTCHSVLTKCDECGAEYRALIRTAKKQMEQFGMHQCRRCSSRRAGKKTAARMSKIYSEMYSGDGNWAKRDDVRKKISDAKKGKEFTEEHKQALRKPKSKTDKIKEAANRPEEIERRKKQILITCQTEKWKQSIVKLFMDGLQKTSIGKSGWVSTDKTIKPIWCRSQLEQYFVKEVSEIESLVSIESAECLRIPYEFDGCPRIYLPDFKLVFDNGDVLLVETKAVYFYEMAQWKAKEKAFKSYCESNGFGCVVLTEKDVNRWLGQLNG